MRRDTVRPSHGFSFIIDAHGRESSPNTPLLHRYLYPVQCWSSTACAQKKGLGYMNDDDTSLSSKDQEQGLSELTIEVCQGPDCCGTGGGAVLLEIEDLVREQCATASEACFKVVAGGCRNHCTMGPNVYIDRTHYTKIDNIEACRGLFVKIGSANTNEYAQNTSPELSPSTTSALRQRQMDRLRWKKLRKKAREKKKQQARHAAGKASSLDANNNT